MTTPSPNPPDPEALRRQIEALQAQLAALTGSVTTGSVGGSIFTGTITADIFIGGNATLIFDDHARRAKEALDAYLQRLVRDIGTLKLSAINTKKLDPSLPKLIQMATINSP